MTYIPADIRRFVIQRANNCCEYCQMRQGSGALDFAIDHIIAEKHGGQTHPDNLCLSCYWCNSRKGSDISSVDWEGSGEVTPLFNPRKHIWAEHFQLDGAVIRPLTAQGRVTVKLLRFNDPQRVMERNVLLLVGYYPCSSE